MITAAEAASDLHNPNEALLVGDYNVKQRTFLPRLLCHSEEKVITKALQEPAGLLMSCCVVSPLAWFSFDGGESVLQL